MWLGNFNKFFVYSYNQKKASYEEIIWKTVPNLYTVSAIAWKKDGSKIVFGNLWGSIDMFEVRFKSIKHKGKF